MTMKQIAGTSCFITAFGDIISSKQNKLKPKLTIHGYHEISLYFGNGVGKKWFRVHRLVAQYYIPNPENKPFVNHKDGNKINNDVSNLEWVTHQENMEHAKNFGLIKRAEENHKTILTTEQSETICKLLSAGYRTKEIASTIGCSSAIISSIRSGTCWTHVSCKYNIPKRSRALSDDSIKWVCSKIEEGLTQGEILKLSDNKRITKTMIKDIRRRRIYADISINYNF